MKTELDLITDNYLKNAKPEESAAAEWIKNNPHVAFVYVLQAHQSWHGCTCSLTNAECLYAGILKTAGGK